MNRRRAHAEVPLQVSFSGRPSEHVRVCIDEGQILPLRRYLPLTSRKQANQYLLRGLRVRLVVLVTLVVTSTQIHQLP